MLSCLSCRHSAWAPNPLGLSCDIGRNAITRCEDFDYEPGTDAMPVRPSAVELLRRTMLLRQVRGGAAPAAAGAGVLVHGHREATRD